MRRLSAIGALVVSYALGFAGGAFLLYPFFGAWSVVICVAGAVVALPLLGVAGLLLLVFHLSITRHRLAWCLAAPPAVLVVWIAAEYGLTYRDRGFSISEYLMIRNVIERSLLVGLISSLTSAAFYSLEPRSRAAT